MKVKSWKEEKRYNNRQIKIVSKGKGVVKQDIMQSRKI